MNTTQFPFSPVLTGFSRDRGLGGTGAGTILAPLVRGTDLKYEYPVFEDNRGTGTIDVERAPGANVKEVQADKFTMEGGLIKDHSIDVKSPIEYSSGAIVSQLPILKKATSKANEAIKRAHETKVNKALWGTNLAGFQAIYGNAKVENLTSTARWTSTAPKMRKNVLDLREKILDDTGYYPNTLLLTAELYNVITSGDNEIKDAIKYTQFGVPDLGQLARYFEVQRIVVPGISFDTANPGVDPVYSKMWTGAHALLSYTDPNPRNESQNLAATFYADGQMNDAIGPFLGIQPWQNMLNKSNMIRCNAYFDVKLINAKCGAVIFNTP